MSSGCPVAFRRFDFYFVSIKTAWALFLQIPVFCREISRSIPCPDPANSSSTVGEAGLPLEGFVGRVPGAGDVGRAPVELRPHPVQATRRPGPRGMVV